MPRNDESFMFENFRAIPAEEGPDNTVWILYDKKMGAYVLDAGAKNRKGRVVAISSATRCPNFDSMIDSTLHLDRKAKRHISARLPKNAPKGGDALLAVALQALKDGFNPTALRLRAGRTRAELEALMQALALLGRAKMLPVAFDWITCDMDPDKPIHETTITDHQHELHPAFVIANDVKIWFAPQSVLGTDCAHASGRKDKPYAQMSVRATRTDITSHELMEAASVVADFYRRAAADLGLNAADLKIRFDLLGL